MIPPIRPITNEANAPVEDINHRFLQLLPAIERYGRYAFRYLPAEAREEATAETIANCFVAFARLVERGKEDLAYATTLARYAVAQIRSGRRVGASLNAQDVYSREYLGSSGVKIRRFGSPREQRGEWLEQLLEDHRTPVPEQAAFRCDFPAWLTSLSSRQQNIAVALANGNRTTDVAREFKVSAGRVSQIRGEFHTSWQTFHGEDDDRKVRPVNGSQRKEVHQ